MPKLATVHSSDASFVKVRWLFCWVVSSLIFVGCQKGGEVSKDQTHLGFLGSMYGMYIGQNAGNSPKSLDDLKKFVGKKATPDRLTKLGVASVDELFKSSRDGKPYALVANVKAPAPGSGTTPVVLYESDGKDGQHVIAYLGGGTDTVDHAKLASLVPKSP